MIKPDIRLNMWMCYRKMRSEHKLNPPKYSGPVLCQLFLSSIRGLFHNLK